jgi:hypothetical protein
MLPAVPYCACRAASGLPACGELAGLAGAAGRVAGSLLWWPAVRCAVVYKDMPLETLVGLLR